MGIILRYKNFLNTYKTRSHRINHLKYYRDLFPIKANITLAGIIADLIGDGNLQGDPKWRLDFTSKSLIELKRFQKEITSIFKVKCKIRRCTSNEYSETYNLAVNCSPIARILYLCGVPTGQKVLTPFNIPFWIKKDKKCFKQFIKRLFSCEGNIMYEKHRKIPQIRMEMWKSEKLLIQAEEFFREIALYLDKYFKIKSTIKINKAHNIRKDGIKTRSLRMYILGKSVIKFYKEIGFEGEKQRKLKSILGKLN